MMVSSKTGEKKIDWLAPGKPGGRIRPVAALEWSSSIFYDFNMPGLQ
jgi:hypothetical protein